MKPLCEYTKHAAHRDQVRQEVEVGREPIGPLPFPYDRQLTAYADASDGIHRINIDVQVHRRECMVLAERIRWPFDRQNEVPSLVLDLYDAAARNGTGQLFGIVRIELKVPKVPRRSGVPMPEMAEPA